jgi:hypothetical protein
MCGDTDACCKTLFCPCLAQKDVAGHIGESECVWCFLSTLACFTMPPVRFKFFVVEIIMQIFVKLKKYNFEI